MRRETVLVRVDRDGVHRELVRGTEDTDSDFLRTKNTRAQPPGAQDAHSGSGAGLTPRLATRILVSGPEWPADFLRMVWMECTGVPGALGVTANMGASRGGWRVPEAGVAIVVRELEGAEGVGSEKAGYRLAAVFIWGQARRVVREYHARVTRSQRPMGLTSFSAGAGDGGGGAGEREQGVAVLSRGGAHIRCARQRPWFWAVSRHRCCHVSFLKPSYPDAVRSSVARIRG